MSLAPEAIAFIGRPPANRHPETKAVHGRAGLARHGATSKPDADPTEPQETPMPRGVYDRKKKADPVVRTSDATRPAAKPEAPTKARKPRAKVKPKAEPKVRAKAAAKATSGPRFSVFEDGAVELRLASCTGIIAPSEAREFLGFLKRIGVE